MKRKKHKKSKSDVSRLIEQAGAAVRKRYRRADLDIASEALAFPGNWYSTGSLALDRLCRGSLPGGIPEGRVVHIAGEWSTGKSLILDHLFKSVQDVGGIALCSEAEGSRDPHFALAIGLRLHEVMIQRPRTLEEAVDVGLEFHASLRDQDPTIPFVWGVDSLDSTQAMKSAESGLTESGGWHYGGGKSEALAAGLRKVIPETARFPTTFVMLNQTREAVGVRFGRKKRTSGGNPPHFYSSLEIMLSSGQLGSVRDEYRGSPLTAEQEKRLGLKGRQRGFVVGRWIEAEITKSKVAPTFHQKVDFYIDFRKGVHQWAGLLQRLIVEGIVRLEKEQIIHKVGEEDRAFEDQSDWLGWLSENLDVLK